MREQKDGMPFLSNFTLEQAGTKRIHIVMLDGIKDVKAIEIAAKGIQGVRFINPTQDISDLLGKYRMRTIYLLIISSALMLPLLFWRYGIKHGTLMMIPPVLTI